MPWFEGYLLDEFHWIGQFKDEDDQMIWIMVIFNAPVRDNVIDGDAGFSYYEIDPNDFEYNGRRVRLEIG